MRNLTITILFVMLLVLPAMSIAQEDTRPEKPKLAEKTFQITHADLEDVYKNTRAILTRYGNVLYDELGKKIMVKDTVENLPKIATMIKGMDLAPHRLMMTVFVFEASRTGTDGDLSMVPTKVKKALDEVKDIMAYKNFKLKTSGMLNSVVKKKTDSRINLSENLCFNFTMDYNPHSKFLMLNRASLEYRVVSQVVKNVSSIKTLFQTDFGIGDGEVVVAGASKLNGGEKALLTVVTLKVKTPK